MEPLHCTRVALDAIQTCIVFEIYEVPLSVDGGVKGGIRLGCSQAAEKE
jgi:hypothetical protein